MKRHPTVAPMLRLLPKLLFCTLLALLCGSNAVDGEADAWKAAMALKQKAAYPEAAAAFAQFTLAFPQSAKAITGVLEEGVCWLSAGRGAQVLHRATPQAQAHFDKALARFQSVSQQHPSAPEAPRAWYLQGSVHAVQGKLALAEANFSMLLDTPTTDKVYLGKALGQRAAVRRSLLRPKDAIADLQRWIKEVGAPADQLEATRTELARALLFEQPAPIYTPETWISGEPAPLESQAGNLVALFFFASWCPNCGEELPFVREMDRRFGPLGVRFIGVTDHGQGQTADAVRTYVAQRQIPFSVFQDNGATSIAYKATAIPMLALIDRSGRLRWVDKPALLTDATIEQLLREGLEPAAK